MPVKASFSLSVDSGSILLPSRTKDLKNGGIHKFPTWRSVIDVVQNTKPNLLSSLVNKNVLALKNLCNEIAPMTYFILF